MTPMDLAFALAMGVIAALLHLGLTWLRAAASLRGRVGLAMLTLPVAVGIPALCLLAALRFSPGFGWMAVLSYALLRTFTIACVVRS